MAYGKSLEMRAIQPRVDTYGMTLATPNPWRGTTNAMAKARRTTRRRVVKQIAREKKDG